MRPKLRRWREDLHRIPELANQERQTQVYLVEALRELGIEPRTYPGFTGVLGLIGEKRPGPVVLLRADMDALPIAEGTRASFRSRTNGRMHACGHDVHMACLLGAAAALTRQERRIPGPVKVLFQPAEEEGGDGGAKPFIERGCLDDPKVDVVVGQHVDPSLPVGTIGWRKGPMMAAADHFVIRVDGRSGHAAYPHRGPDAIVASAEIVAGLSGLVSRLRDPVDPVVVSVGEIHGGTRHNILPARVTIEGTTRTFRSETRDAMERAIRRRARRIADSLGARATITYRRGYPTLVNPPAATEVIVGALGNEFGEAALRELKDPVMGAEDFARYLEKVPGTFLFLGVGEKGRAATLHSETFLPPESALEVGTATLAAAATAWPPGTR